MGLVSSQRGWHERGATGPIERSNEQMGRLIESQENEYVSFPESRSKR